MKFETIKSGWFIVYIEGSHAKILKIIWFSFSDDVFV